MSKLRAYLTLMRPPNLLTAVSDVVAGFAAAIATLPTSGKGAVSLFQADLPWGQLAVLSFSSTCLYAGGVVLNDYYDARIDQVERPERPIPSGKVKPVQALVLGYALLLAGVLQGFYINHSSGLIALGIAILVLVYDKVSKHHPFWGPLNMGGCRGANLLLGISIVQSQIEPLAFLMIIPIVYVAAITLVSRGEVHGSAKINFELALGIYAMVGIMVMALGFMDAFNLLHSLPVLVFFFIWILPSLIKARSTNQPALIGLAVKSAVLGLIALNAALAAGFAGWFFGLLLLLLLPVSILLAKLFAVS